MTYASRMFAAALLSVLVLSASIVRAEDEVAEADDKMQELYKQLETQLTNTKFVGRFTVLGKEDGNLPKEEYTILSAKKTDKGDWWLLSTRIKYGKNDLTVPLALRIQWAGETPVITLTDFTIPGLGTFSSRVVIYNKKYAGTWTHGKAGGHLFGTLERVEEEKEAAANDEK
ncbi:MAG: hypothetical protein ACI9G1_000015 [Pirellulaceae bacterium]|jgi:uncharacterized protein (UPF0335 family)